MYKVLIVVFLLWVLHSRAHLESSFNWIGFQKGSFSASTVTSEETPVSIGEISGGEVQAGNRPWREPDFSGQSRFLGYKSEAFKTPKGLERPVKFWTDIYTKYSTHQGVIHDGEYIDLIYEVVDFTEINKRIDLSPRQKEKTKKKMVNEAKERISQALVKLDTTPDPSKLSGQEKHIWEYMKSIPNPKKFKEANGKNRIRFQLGQSDRMKSAIYFSGRYLEDFEKIFKEEKLPIELTRLVFVESSFNVMARSKVGASGLWQIMPSVARPVRYINKYVDRRNDPWDATRLAARVLASNYRMLEDWPLAITGYNHGPNGVRRLSEKHKTKDIADLVFNERSKRNFGFASRNFYASFLAALEVERNAKKYFPDIQWSEKFKIVPFKTTSPLSYKDLAQAFEDQDQKVDIINPHLTFKVKARGAQIPTGTKIYVPADKIAFFEKKVFGRRVAGENLEVIKKIKKPLPGN